MANAQSAKVSATVVLTVAFAMPGMELTSVKVNVLTVRDRAKPDQIGFVD